jgi:imidazolonepropionase-like amidohydrolase
MLILKGGNIHCESGEVKLSTDVLIDGRLIKEIGKGLVAEEAEEVDVSGKEVFAGFIVPCTSVGLIDFTDFRKGDHNETSDPITPELNVKHALDRREIYMQQYHYTGITAFGAAPGVNNVLSGQIGVYNTAGETVKKMCIKEFAAIKGNFTVDVKAAYGKRDVAPMSKMGIASLLRNALVDSRAYMEKEEKEFDVKKEALSALLNREVPLVINARTAAEINAIIGIAQEFDLKLVIHNAFQPEKCEEVILENQYPVMMGQLQSMGASISYETDLTKVIEMQEKGALICLSNSGDRGFSGRETLLWSAIKLVQAGAEVEDVIKMVTINSAKALGVDDVIGSLEKKKQADIVVYDGHPLKTFDANVAYSIVAGDVVYKRTGGFEKCCL